MADLGPHVQRGHPIFFSLLLFFAIIEGCITAWLVARFNDQDNYPTGSYRDRLRFLVFISWWTVVFAAGYLAVFLVSAGNFLASIASHGVWLALTWVFWLAGAAAYTAALGGGKRCSVDPIIYCNQLVAAEAFAWIELILITVLTVVVALMGLSALRRGDSLSGPLV